MIQWDDAAHQRQGPDDDTQYRSAIFYRSDAQRREAEAYIRQLTDAKYYPAPIVTEVTAFTTFYPAEAYHQDFMAHHPDNLYIVYNDRPKIERYKRVLPDLYVGKK